MNWSCSRSHRGFIGRVRAAEIDAIGVIICSVILVQSRIFKHERRINCRCTSNNTRHIRPNFMTLAVLGLAHCPALDLKRQERLRRHTGNRFRRHLQILRIKKPYNTRHSWRTWRYERFSDWVGPWTNRAVCGENPIPPPLFAK